MLLFAMVKEVEGRPAASLKNPARNWQSCYVSSTAMYDRVGTLIKRTWSTVYLDGSLPDSQLYYLVDASYQQAVNALPEDKRKQLPQS